jgi:predicted transcriptional regulator
MTLTIELPPEMEQQLQEAASRAGQDPEALARAAAAEKLAALQAHDEARRQRQLAMIERWNSEDAARTNDVLAPRIPRLSLREPGIGVCTELNAPFGPAPSS